MTNTPVADDGSSAQATHDRSILEQRARILARPLADAADDGEAIAVLGFSVAAGAYAVEIAHVREVVATADVSRLPWAPPAVAGVTSIRGEVVVVTDAGRVLGVGDASATGPVVVLHAGGHTLGLQVDAVEGVTAIAAADLAAPVDDSTRLAADLVAGVTGSTIVVDALTLCSDHRLTIHHQEGT